MSLLFAAVLVAAAAAVALCFKPFAVLRGDALRTPWFASLALVPFVWSSPAALPGGPSLQLSLACLLVLMFGWPLAIWTLLPVAALAAWFLGASVAGAIELAAWQGVLPATFALALGMAVRRWLPPHVFVYILARGFAGTAIAVMLAGALGSAVRPLPPGTNTSTLLVAHWLIGWGEAVLTGMLASIFVAFRPQWLLTWSDKRYLPRRNPPGA